MISAIIVRTRPLSLLLALLMITGLGAYGSPASADGTERAFQSLPPARVLDTRPGDASSTIDGEMYGSGRQGAGLTLELPIAGRAGVPDNARGVVFNVTAIDAVEPGYLTVYPCGAARPYASNVNFQPGEARANLVVAKIGTHGTVCVYTSAEVHIAADVNGYATNDRALATLVPARLLDSRPHGNADIDGGSGALATGSTYELQVANRAGVPADAAGVVLNVGATQPESPGFLTVYPCDTPRPWASNVNFEPGRATSTAVLSAVSSAGTVCIYTSATTNVIADVNGFLPSSPSLSALTPARVLDTRRDGGAATIDRLLEGIGQQQAGSTFELSVKGRGGVPSDATGVVFNVTVIAPRSPGYLTVYACGDHRPLASAINYRAGAVVSNTVVAPIGHTGTVCIYTSTTTDIVADINGFIVDDPTLRPATQPRETTALLGAYMGQFNQQPDVRFKDLTGQYADIMSGYWQADGLAGSTMNMTAMNARIDVGTIPLIAVSMANGPWTHAQVASGAADSWLEYWATTIAALNDGEIWVTFDHEFEVKRNQGQYTWSPTDAEYAAAYARFHDMVAAARIAAGKTPVKSMYMWGYFRHREIDNIGRLISQLHRPDLLAFDPYVFAHWNPSTSFEEMLVGNGKLDWTLTRTWYDGQPIGLGEFGKDSVHGQSEAASFLTDLRSRMDAAGLAFGFYFSRDKSGDVLLDITPAGTFSGWPGTRGAYTKSAGSLAGGAAVAGFIASVSES